MPNASWIKVIATLIGSFFLGTSFKVVAAPLMVDNEMTPEVQMNEYILASASQFPVIQTYGATTCVILILSNVKTKMAVLAHVSAAVNVRESVKQIISDLKKTKNSLVDVRAEIYGGWKNSSELIVKDIKSALKSEKIKLVKDEALRFVGPNLKDPLALLSNTPQAADSMINVQLDVSKGAASYYVESVPSQFVSKHFDGILPPNGILYRHESSLLVK